MDIEGKAFFLMQYTSGARIGEILSLTFDNIEMEHEYPRIYILYNNAKNGRPCRTRISPEAKHYLLEYLKERDKIINSRANRVKDTKYLQSNLIFPMSHQNAYDKWNRALIDAGYYHKDQNTNIATMSPHSLRRLFKTQFKKYSFNWAQFFMNQNSELDKIYDSTTDEELDFHYSRGVKYLLIERIPIDTDKRIKELEQNVEKLKEELEIAQTYIKNLTKNLTKPIPPKNNKEFTFE